MEDTVLSQFRVWGFHAEKIPENQREKRPDFLVRDTEGVVYLVELKEKADDPEKLQRITAKLDADEMHVSITPVKPRNTMSGIIGDAELQLKSANHYKADYNLVWLAASGIDHEEKYEQFFATLYGSTRIWNLDPAEPTKYCYFFRNSSFFRFRSIIDAAILTYNESAQLCLNPHSERYASIKSTGLYNFFVSENACIDPLQEELDCDAYIADTDLDRRNEQSIVDYLCKKYKAELMNIDVGYHAFTVGYPEKET